MRLLLWHIEYMPVSTPSFSPIIPWPPSTSPLICCHPALFLPVQLNKGVEGLEEPSGRTHATTNINNFEDDDLRGRLADDDPIRQNATLRFFFQGQLYHMKI